VAATAFGLLAVFLINLISGAMPLKLLDPQWQLRVILQLIANVSFPLVGFMLICLAPQIDPGLALLQRWRHRSQTLALGAVLLFLLIIPLQTTRAGRSSARRRWSRPPSFRTINAGSPPCSRPSNRPQPWTTFRPA
jgi:hypothetical protein